LEEILEKVKSWLEKGGEEAGEIAELPWDTDYVKDSRGEVVGLVAINPKVPVKLFVLDNREVNAIRLMIHTGIYTADLEPASKLKVYRKLLSLNKTPLAKIYLEGGDGEVVVASDLSTKTLGEEEFYDTLTFTLNTMLAIYNVYGIPAEVKQDMLANLVWMIKKRMEKGWNKERLEKFLVNKVGMNREDADNLLNTVFQESGENGENSETLYV